MHRPCILAECPEAAEDAMSRANSIGHMNDLACFIKADKLQSAGETALGMYLCATTAGMLAEVLDSVGAALSAAGL